MQDYAIQRCTRKCAVLDRPLESGERYFSVIVSKGAELVRQDISEQAWQGPPDGTVGWWRATMPQREAKALQPAPVHVLLDTLTQLCEQPDSAELAYLLGVLLVRRRVLVDQETNEEPRQEDLMYLVNPEDGNEFLVPLQPPDLERIEQLQKSLTELLYQEA
jgi:hypothetical protein